MWGGSGDMGPLILNLGTRRRWIVIFMPQSLYLRRKSHWSPLNRTLGGLHRQLSLCGVQKTLLCPALDRTTNPQSQSPVTVPAIIFRLHLRLFSHYSTLSHDRSTASSKTIPPLNAIYSFLLQMRVSSPVSKHLAYMVSQFLERYHPGKVIMW
jgi:hypothetical protein